MTVPQLVDVLLAERVARVIVTTEDLGRYRHVKLPRGVVVWDRTRIAEAQRVLAATPGVTVLVHDQECATEKRRKRKRGRVAQPQTRCSSTSGSARAAGTAGASPTACRCSRCRPSSAARPACTSPPATSTTAALDGDCPAFMTVVPAAGRTTADAGAGVGAISPEELRRRARSCRPTRSGSG
jgi:Indolepyruvate ferredoxin oxidoreductase, alpha and beta subunits